MTISTSWGTSKGFDRFCEHVGLKLERFQRLIVREVFHGRRELLVLIPRGCGKTTLFGALALYHLLVVDEAKVFIGAAATDQAGEMLDVIEEFIGRSTQLANACEVVNYKKRIRYGKRNGYIQVLSSDGPKQHGKRPTLVLIDELHAHENDDLYVAMKTAMGKRMDAQMVVISTAGHNQERVLWRMREGFHECPSEPNREPRLRIARNDLANSAMLEWAADLEDDLSDGSVVKLCNPASFVRTEFLNEQIASPGLTEWEFARYHANRWTPTFQSWLPPGAWDGCFEDGARIPLGEEVVLGVDVGLRRDTSAVVAVWQRPDLRWVVQATVWKPPGGDDALDLLLVEQQIRRWQQTHTVRLVAYDKWAFQRSAQMLEEEGFVMNRASVDNAYTVPAWARVHEAISRREIVHDGNPVLAAHVAAGIKVDTERGWRITKAKAKKPIDGLFALMLAFTEAGQTGWDGDLAALVSW